jgi:hypothetical protein
MKHCRPRLRANRSFIQPDALLSAKQPRKSLGWSRQRLKGMDRGLRETLPRDQRELPSVSPNVDNRAAIELPKYWLVFDRSYHAIAQSLNVELLL